MARNVLLGIQRQLAARAPAVIPRHPVRAVRKRVVGARTTDAMVGINAYSSRLSRAAIAAKRHRLQVGGMWDEIGMLQFQHLVAEGLKPHHRLIDVGCGAMRGGIHFARYLDPGHYYGTDINDRLIEAALSVEVPAAGLVDRMPPENLRVTGDFDARFGVQFDFALSVSLFTHLPLNHIRLCLARTYQALAPGGRFHATFFRAPDDLPYEAEYAQRTLTTYPTADPFHYRVHELEWAARVTGLDFRYVGDWAHPRAQEMAVFTRPDG